MVASLALLSQPAVTWTEEDRQLLWEEAVHTHNGLLYKFKLYYFPSRELAESVREQRGGLWTAKIPKRELVMLHNELPYQLRERIAGLGLMDPSEPMLMPNGKDWVIVEVIEKMAAKFNTHRDLWLDKYGTIALPPPSELRQNPVYVTRRSMNQIKSTDDLRQALAEHRISRTDLGRPCSNGFTLLVKAVLQNDVALAGALLDQGADPNTSTSEHCPLALAVALKHTEVARLLLGRGASPNGSPRLRTPLMEACANLDKASAQWLLDAGADPLASRIEQIGPGGISRSALFYVPSKETAFLDWFKGIVDAALQRSGDCEWSGWIEQSGARTRIQPGATIKLKKAPFRVILAMKGEIPFVVVASEDKTLHKRMQDAAFHRMAVGGAYVGASDKDSKYLSVAGLEMNGDYLSGEFRSNEWGYYQDPERARGTMPITEGATGEFVHEVEELITPSGNYWIQDYPGRSLLLAMGVLPPIGSGTQLYKPVMCKLSF